MNYIHLPEVALLLTVLGRPVTPMTQEEISQSLGLSKDVPRMSKHGKLVGNSAKVKVGLKKATPTETVFNQILLAWVVHSSNPEGKTNWPRSAEKLSKLDFSRANLYSKGL
jgi:hypothetical protein